MIKKENKNWKFELARDFLALGSWVFFILVIIRIIEYRPYVYQFAFSAIILIVFGFLVKNYEGYVARGFVLTVFTVSHYNELYFTIFAPIVYFGMIISSRYLGNKWKEIFNGLVIGLVSTLAGYYLVNWLF